MQFHGFDRERRVNMELARRYLARHRTAYAAYIALQRALMRHYIARGGSAGDFCSRLAPVFRRRFGSMLIDAQQANTTTRVAA
jgi:hypothetical protein